MEKRLRVLLLEDDALDAELVGAALAEGGVSCDTVLVDTPEGFVSALEAGGFDLILADYNLPSFDGMMALAITLEKSPDTPFIFVSGTMGEELAVETLKQGATDYVLKAGLHRLVPSVNRALREAEGRAELKASEETLRAERQRFNEVLDMLPLYVVLLTPDYHVPFANRFFRERFGESGGKRCFEYLFKRSEPCEICETYKVLKDMKPRRWEWTGPDGRYYDISDFPFTDTDGSTLILEMGVDITERKQNEAELLRHRDHLEELVGERTGQLKAANAQLRESQREQDDFYAMVTHDLKSPLTAISLQSDLLQQSLPPDSDGEAAEMAAEIQKNANKLLDMVEDFLAFSRMASGKARLKESLVDMPRLLEDAYIEFRVLAEKKGLRLDKDLSGCVPKLLLDKKQVERAIRNLLQNAVNYTRPGGRVSLNADCVDWEGNFLVVSVSDTGPGIPKEEQARLFDRYYRSPSVSGVKGSGLGLAIVKAVAEAHGGRIDLESAIGKGSTFRMFLPL